MLSAIVDVLIVLSAVYVGLSCFISWMNETVQSLLRARGKYLYDGVLNLLCGHDGLVNTIFSSPYVTSASNDLLKRNDRPSYVEPQAFATALWDSVRRLNDLTKQPGADDLFKTPDVLLGDLRQRVTALHADNAPLAGVLANLLGRAQGDYQKLLDITADWFDAQMDHVSGWYRRYTQWFIVAIAALVVSFGGIDSIQMATLTFGNQKLAQEIVAPISKALGQQNSGKASDVAKAVNDVLAHVDYFGYHFGWNPFASWGGHWAGMLLTLAALTLGGTFWFDLLKTLVNVRQTGKKPDEAAAM